LSICGFFERCAVDGREANDAWLSQTAGNPAPDHVDPLEAVRMGFENVIGVQGMDLLFAGGMKLCAVCGEARVGAVRAGAAGTPSRAS
jgi:hypothetical protein